MSSILTSPTGVLSPPCGARPEEISQKRAGDRRFFWSVIGPLLACDAVGLSLMLVEQASLASTCFWGMAMVALVRLASLRRTTEMFCLVIGMAPVMYLFRTVGYAPYNIVSYVLLAVVGDYIYRNQSGFLAVVRNCRLAVAACLWILAYYISAVVWTGSYASNLRFFDCGLSLLGILIVGRRLAPLAVALKGSMISAGAVAVVILKFTDAGAGGRPGGVLFEGGPGVNPMAVGAPLAVAFLFLLMDQGAWVQWCRRPWLRAGWLLAIVALLGLSTSRASWLMTLGGVVFTLLFGRRQRVKLLLTLVLAGVALQLVLLTPYGLTFQRAIDRTFSSERTAAGRTSGRSYHWVVTYYAMTSSARKLLVGHGPGAYADIYNQYAEQVEGVRVMDERWTVHSLFLQVAADFGLLGLGPLVLWLGMVAWQALRWGLDHERFLPLAALAAYLAVIVSVSGADSHSGVLLGISLLPTAPWLRKPAHPAP